MNIQQHNVQNRRQTSLVHSITTFQANRSETRTQTWLPTSGERHLPRGLAETQADLVHERFNLWSQAQPREIRRATGQVVLNLWLNPKGLSKWSLMEMVDEAVSTKSEQYVLSLEAALSKRIQRARSRIRKFGLDIVFDRMQGLWKLSSC